MIFPCIRCGLCETVCPVGLQPQFLHAASAAEDWSRVERLNLDSCLFCQACTAACPSQIPLQTQFIEANKEIQALRLKEVNHLQNRLRFEAKEARKLRVQQLQEEARLAKLKVLAKDEKQAAIEAALARVQWKFEDA